MRNGCMALFALALVVLGAQSDQTKTYGVTEGNGEAGSYRLTIEQIFDGHQHSATEIAAAEAKLHDLVSRAVRDALGAQSADSGSVERAMDATQGASVMKAGTLSPWQAKLPFADVDGSSGVPTAVVAFEIFCGGPHSYLQFYSRPGSAWELRKEVAFGTNERRSAARVPSALVGQARYLAFGSVMGNPGAPLLLSLYGFDGHDARLVAERGGMAGGKLTIIGDHLELWYDEPALPGEPDYRRGVHETVRMGVAGFEPVLDKR